MTNEDRQLGMGTRITRRDFLNGVATGIGTLGAGRTLDPAALLCPSCLRVDILAA